MAKQDLLIPRSNKSDLARLRLLEAAIEVFGQKGRDGATVRDIAKASGQNVAAITYYFGGKDALYGAVMEGLTRVIRETLADVLAEIAAFRARTRPSPDDALPLLQRFLQAVYSRLLSRKEVLAMGRLIVREQMQPTAAFEILYEQGFRQVHEDLCFLVGTYLEHDPRAPEVIIRTHTLMGQVYFFAMARETILRRLGWKSLEGKNAELVTAVIAQNIAVLLRGLVPKARQGKVNAS